MRVILFRHGPAGRRDPERWADDSARPLTASGARLTRNAAEGLERIEPEIAQIVSSPFERTRQTARVLSDVLETGPFEELDALRPDEPLGGVLEYLVARHSDRDVVLVGHEPGLSALAGLLLFGPSVSLPLRKAGACAIRFENGPGEAAGELVWLLPPKLLRRAAPRKRHV